MGIEYQQIIYLTCDVCGKESQVDQTDTRSTKINVPIRSLKAAAKRYGWTIKGEACQCKKCNPVEPRREEGK